MQILIILKTLTHRCTFQPYPGRKPLRTHS